MSPPTECLADLAEDLRKRSSAHLHRDLPTRLLYATDASIYQITPLAVVIPQHVDDVLATVEACAKFQTPLLPRGGGSSLAGQAVGEAVVIDFSRHLRQVIRVDGRRRRVLVQPGITLDALNRTLRPYGLMVGPDPASGDRATLGGIIANNSTGAHSLHQGMMSDHVVSLHVILSDGSEARLGPTSWAEVDRRAKGGSLEASLYREMPALLRAHAALIDTQFPTYWRRAGGYNLDALRRQLAGETCNLAALLSGSEGTLAVTLEAEINLVPIPRQQALAVLSFPTLDAAFRAVPELLALHPTAIELIDDVLLGLTRASPQWRRHLTFVVGNPAALLVLEFTGEDEREIAGRLRGLAQAGWEKQAVIITDRAGQADVWKVRKAGLGLLASMRGDAKPTPGIEDVAVPPERLADYMAELQGLMAGRGVASAMYAHASAGCIHVRPILNLKSSAGVQTLVELTTAAADLARRYGGVLSSEHGDGLARSYLNPRFFGPAIYELFRSVKAIFDPHNLLNPGKIVDAPAPDQHLRFGPTYQILPLSPVLDWSEYGSFAQAVEMCNGAGVCRKLDVGAMCPSFQALREEQHSTRGRANLLRAALTGQLPGGLHDPALAAALDLCLGCKACASECPSSVDMTRMKTEVLAQRYQQERPSRPARFFGHVDRVSAAMAPVAPLANRALSWGPGRRIAARLLGLHPERTFPRLAWPVFTVCAQKEARIRTGEAFFAGQDGEIATLPRPPAPTSTLALFPDTFTEFNAPAQGLAALRVLQAAGRQVVLAPRHCCGRALLSQGLVEEAKVYALRLIAALLPFAQAGIPVVGLEPSCVLTVRADYPALIPGAETRLVAQNIFLFDEVLTGFLNDLPLAPRRQRYLVHGHCHQKALATLDPTLAALRAIPGAQAELIDAGCCGMAGAFGYAPEHYTLSVAIANDRLLPALRAQPDAALVVNGFSCRCQIQDLAHRPSFHLAEVLAAALIPGK